MRSGAISPLLGLLIGVGAVACAGPQGCSGQSLHAPRIAIETGGAGAGGGDAGEGGAPAVDAGPPDADASDDAAGDPTSVAASSRWAWTVACVDGHAPQDPVDYGRCAIDQARDEAGNPDGASVSIAVLGKPEAAAMAGELASLVDARPESYVVATKGDTTWVLGRDEVGAMYGALEVAERLRLQGAKALPIVSPVRGAPALGVRAANLFWTLPETGETAWWFLDEGFWRDYLDLLAHARINLLDLHGMYDPRTTAFPNALLYLARSATFPGVGVPAADRERNLRMLDRVIVLARARGVRVALMSYLASSSPDGVTPEALSDADLSTYDREAAADVATRAPQLSMLGFRIGETGKPAPWYVGSIVAGVHAAGTGVGIYTRSWLSRKNDILTLAAAAGPDLLLEAKLNGEHLGPPYVIAGGRMAGWSSYSYQNYLDPPTPWRFVFQVRLGGTHRIFRQASFARTRRAVLAMGMSPTVRGFSLEPPHAFSPQRDFYHAHSEDQVSPWTFVRDDLMYLLWGRLGYDPETPEPTFRALAARETAGRDLWPLLQAAGDIVPWIQTAHTCGPDQRDYAPELELGGDVAQWAKVASGPHAVASCDNAGPFDSFAIASPADAAADLVAGVATARLSPRDVAAQVLEDARRVDIELGTVGADADAEGGDALVRDVVRESRALADLGRYFAHKLSGATALAVYARSGHDDWRAAARAETKQAAAAWRALALDTAYIRPFADPMRMRALGYEPFHWAAAIPELASDDAALDAVARAVGSTPPAFEGALPEPTAWLASTRAAGPGLAELTVSPAPSATTSTSTSTSTSAPTPMGPGPGPGPGPRALQVRVRLAAPLAPGGTVSVLWKPFASEHDFASIVAAADADGVYTATLPLAGGGPGAGALVAVEVRTDAGAWRYPDSRERAPYVSSHP